MLLRLRATPRTTELGLLVLAGLITLGLWVLTSLGRTSSLPADILPFLGVLFLLLGIAHIAIRRFAPLANPALLPIAALLNGIGYVIIARLNPKLAGLQSNWTAVAVLAFVATIILVRRVRDLGQYRYLFALLGISLLIAPIFFGENINGSKIWIRIGPASFQPGEIAKIVLAVFFASYLTDNRELLARPTRRLGRLLLPDVKHFGPILVAWFVAMLVLIFENDFGSSLLFFALFITVLYVGTGRIIYVLISAFMLGVGAFGALKQSDHVQQRVDIWLDPWKYEVAGYQIMQSEYAMGAGGILGSGLGLGNPTKIPAATTDFIFAAIGEELGLLGTTAILIGFLAFLGIGFRIALRATNPFEKLLATGLTAIVGIQTFVIIGGILRVMPLTGVTLPFVSYGGSSLVTNYILLALLLRISHEQTDREKELGSTAQDPELLA